MNESLRSRGTKLGMSCLLHPGPRAARRLRLAVVTVLGMMWACSAGLAAAQAHAIIVESSPRHEESVTPPRRLVLRFNGRIEKTLCSVQLIGPQRRTIVLLRQEPDTSLDTLASVTGARARRLSGALEGHVRRRPRDRGHGAVHGGRARAGSAALRSAAR